MKSKTYWTVRDGVIGTAHTSRDGREVDFRPAGLISGSFVRRDSPAGVFDGWLARHDPVPADSDHEITVQAADGVRADTTSGLSRMMEPLRLVATLTDFTPWVEWGNDSERRERTLAAEFRGVTVVAPGSSEERPTAIGEAKAAGRRAALDWQNAERRWVNRQIRMGPRRGVRPKTISRLRRSDSRKAAAIADIIREWTAFYGAAPITRYEGGGLRPRYRPWFEIDADEIVCMFT